MVSARCLPVFSALLLVFTAAQVTAAQSPAPDEKRRFDVPAGDATHRVFNLRTVYGLSSRETARLGISENADNAQGTSASANATGIPKAAATRTPISR
jgi:hypothetical protein